MMMKKVVLYSIVTSLVMSFCACSTTQKTQGEGLTSVVAQNVVRLACVKGLQEADMSSLNGQPVELKLSGFVDDSNKGILELMFRNKAEEAGARLVPDNGKLELEVATMTAGNDQGGSHIPILTRSERTEGSVDVQMTIRDIASGQVIHSQPIHGEAKYQQTSVIGFQGDGSYFIKDGKRFVKVPDPSTYR